MATTVLAIDDDEMILELVRVACETIEHTPIACISASTMAEGMQRLHESRCDLVIADHFLPDGTGREFLAHVKSVNPEVPVIVMTAHESTEAAVDFLKAGAEDYVVKPLKGVEIQHALLRCLKVRDEAEDENRLHRALPPGSAELYLPGIRSSRMRRVLSILSRATDGTATVLMEGESGSGKEVLARLLHEAGPRRDGPFVAVNCAALPEGLVEAELFGAKRGAYTGAVADRVGRFVEADGGTLFLDEVGEIPLSTQVKLLRAVQERAIEPVGSNHPVSFNTRIIAATNRELEGMVNDGTFRKDLFYRLRVIAVSVPPLRERREDIPALIDLFFSRFKEANNPELTGISGDARECLMRYDYPGNIRELENAIERAVVLARGSKITPDDLPAEITDTIKESVNAPLPEGTSELDRRLIELESSLIGDALKASGGNKSEAARQLGISERRLRSRIARLGIAPDSGSPPQPV